MLGWGRIAQLCLVNAAIGAMAALPINLFNRLMTVELALPALLPGLLVALHYAVQVSRPLWGHRSDRGGRRTPFVIGGMAVLVTGVVAAAWAVSLAEVSLVAALAVWIGAYVAIGVGIGAAGTSFLALLAAGAADRRKGAAATLAWLFLILGAVVGTIGTGILIEPYSVDRLMVVVPAVSGTALVLTMLATLGVERRLTAPTPARRPPPTLREALSDAWADSGARRFTGFVFLSILAFYLSELILEPFAGHVHGLPPEASTKISGGKDGAALLGMLAAGGLSMMRLGGLRFWAITGCVISALGLVLLGAGLPLIPATLTLGLGNGLFVVGAIGSMMRMAAADPEATGTRMGVFGAAQAIAAGLAGLIATGSLDLARLVLPDAAAYGTLFAAEAVLFLAAAWVAVHILAPAPPRAAAIPGE